MNSEMFIFNITDFLARYGPSPQTKITADVIDACKNYLLGRNVLENGKDGHQDIWTWTGFPTVPSKSGKEERQTFDPLKDIVNGIWDYAKEVQKKKNHPYDFKMVPKNHIKSSISGANHMMDACVIAAAYKDKLVNNMVVMPVELKNLWTEKDQIIVRATISHLPLTTDRFIGSRTSPG